jgi:hypothetical protein
LFDTFLAELFDPIVDGRHHHSGLLAAAALDERAHNPQRFYGFVVSCSNYRTVLTRESADSDQVSFPGKAEEYFVAT